MAAPTQSGHQDNSSTSTNGTSQDGPRSVDVQALLGEYAPLTDNTNKLKALAALTRVGVKSDDATKAIDAYAHTARVGKFAGRSASKITPRSLRWMWNPWVPLGSLTLLYGEEGLGKGVLAAYIAAQATLGLLEGHHDGEPVGVEWVTFEDDPDSVIVPRLVAAGADRSMVTIHEAGDRFEAPLIIPDDVGALAEAMEGRGSKLLIIDPLPDALADNLKDNNNGDVRRGLIPLQELAKAQGAAVLGLAHPNKGASRAADKVMGSKAWRSVPRSVVLLGRDPDDESGPTRIVCLSKSNGSGQKPSVRLRIEDTPVDLLDGDGQPVSGQPCAVIEGDSSYTDADLVTFTATGKLASQRKPMTQEEKAADLIIRLLTEGGGEVQASVAYSAGAAVELPEAVMRRARKTLNVVSRAHKWSVPDGWKPPLDF